MKRKNFTDVIAMWNPHTFIPTIMYEECNQIYPDGTNVILPSCDGIDPKTKARYPTGVI